MKPAAQLLLGAVFSLLAIAPVPFQKWALPRIASGGFALVCFSQAKKKLDNDLSLQRQVDAHELDALTQQKQIMQSLQAIEIQATQERELVRTQFQNELEKARMQEHFVVAMEHERPGYLEYQEARRIANLQAQNYSADVQDGGRAIENQIVDPQLLAVQNANPDIRFYDFDDGLKDDAVGIIIAGNSGSGKTSVGAWLAGKLTESNPAQVFALDPHFNDNWKENGIHAIGNFAKIEEALGLLVEELDARRERKEKDKPLGDTIICFLDELNACLLNFQNPEKCELALKRLGSEGRKFGLILITLNQSSNVDDLGISGPYRANYLLVLTGQSAVTLTNKWKQDDARTKWILAQAYPCIVAGSVNAQVALHPTHSTYVKYKKKGNPPLNMGVVNQLPLTFLPEHLASVGGQNTVKSDSKRDITPTSIASIETQKAQLDATFNKAYNPLDYLLQEASQEQLDELIRGWRELADTSASRVSNTLIPKEVSDTENQGYQTPKPLLGKESQSIWTEDDFAKHLPKKDERELFEKLLEYQDESQDASKIIKTGWGFTSKYQIGRACFVYLITKYGGEAQKKLYADYINQYLGINPQDDGVER